MERIFVLFDSAFNQTLLALSHNWPYLLASIFIAAALKVFIKSEKVADFLSRFRKAGVVAATIAAVATPFCSCGTTAVVLGMMASSMPLAPIVAFIVASPLSSPQGLLYSAGLFGWPFATGYFLVSIVLGLAGGALAGFLESRSLLKAQFRFGTSSAKQQCCLPSGADPCIGGYGVPVAPWFNTPSLVLERTKEFLSEILSVSKTLVPMFTGFAFLGYLLNGIIPASWIPLLFGDGKIYSVPLAATIGLPLYLSSEAALPLIRALLDSGMSLGAVMAFLIAGSGTSLGALSGALAIVRWKVIALVVSVLWLGAILAGWSVNMIVAVG
jgi:hypothetical protein